MPIRHAIILFLSFGLLSLLGAPDARSDELQRAMDFARQNQFAEALSQLNAAAEEARGSGSAERQARILIARSEVNRRAGFSDRALANAKAAEKLATDAGLARLAVIARRNVASLYFLTGKDEKIKEANQEYQRLLGLAKKVGDRALLASVYNDLGLVKKHEGKLVDAAASLRKAAKLYGALSMNSAKAGAHINLATLFADQTEGQEKQEESIRALDKALALAKRAKTTSEQLELLSRISGTALAFPAGSEADSIGRKAASRLQRLATQTASARFLAIACGNLALLDERSGDKRKALLGATKALLAAESLHMPEQTYRWHWLLGRLRREEGNLPLAHSHYKMAMDQIEKYLRFDLLQDPRTKKIVFSKELEPIYREDAEVILSQATQTQNQQDKKRHLRDARNTLETLKAVELADYFGDNCVTALEKKKVEIDRLPVATAALYPIILDNRLELLLSLPDGKLRQHTVPVSKLELETAVDEFRLRLEDDKSHKYWNFSKELYQSLIEPIEPDLDRAKIKSIVFVPDGKLRTIPLAALSSDGTPGGYLIKRYSVAVTPGLKLINPQTLAQQRPEVLALGLSVGVRDSTPLPNVAREVATVQELFHAATFRDSAFTHARVDEELKKTSYRIVHIATHGKFDPDPAKSYLRAYDEDITLDNLERLIKFGRFRDDPVELLTMSACQTAAGDDRAALGLAGVAVKSGARSTLATLWSVNDRATSLLMRAFYEGLKTSAGNVSKSQLLRRAQLKLLANENTSHPYFWSPYLIIGNWR